MKPALLAVLLVAFAPFDASGFFICSNQPPENRVDVTEHYEAATDRYHLSWRSPGDTSLCVTRFDEIPPPADTTLTGLRWSTPASPVGCGPISGEECPLQRQACVYRMRGQPGHASLFLSINPGDCAAAAQLGWTRVHAPVMTAFEVQPATQRCHPWLVPVRRFVNAGTGQPMNHRYVADEGVQREMRSRPGWVEEGTAFCVQGSSSTLWQSNYYILGLRPESPMCAAGAAVEVPCLEAVNLASLFGAGHGVVPLSASFTARTGMAGPASAPPLPVYFAGYPAASLDEVLSRSFVHTAQFSPPGGAGFQLHGSDRAGGNLSSIVARFPAAVRPFAGYEVDMDLTLRYQLLVKRVHAEGAGDAAYVQPLVNFVDSRSGLGLVLSAGAIGTPEFADGAFRDASSGDVLVFVTLGPETSVGASLGAPSLRTPRSFEASGSGVGGVFVYRLNRSDFRHLLARARAVEPRLSDDPGDYSVESLGLKGEVAGDARIGFNLGSIGLSLSRP